MLMRETKAFQKGIESKQQEIAEMGWEAARDKFNLEHPPGESFTWETFEAECFSHGEYKALSKEIE